MAASCATHNTTEGTGSDATWAEGDGDPYSDGTGGLGGDAGNGGAITLTFSPDTEPAAAYLLDSTAGTGGGGGYGGPGYPTGAPGTAGTNGDDGLISLLEQSS